MKAGETARSIGAKVMKQAEPTDDTPVKVWTTGQLPSGPNPFNPRTQIRFSVAARQQVTVNAYNARGELVRRLANESFDVGEHVLTWDGKDDRGQDLGSGPYLLRFKSGGMVTTKRLMLVR